MKAYSTQPMVILSLLLATIVVVSACQFGDKNIHFTEEVQLASGETIHVERFIKAAPLGEVGGPGGWSSDYESFEVVGEKRSTGLPKWFSTSGLSPVLFDKDSSTGEWVVIASFYTCDAWYALGRPKLPYAEFRVRAGQWQKVELSTQWLGRATNIFTGVRSSGEPKLLTLADKKSRVDVRTAPEYRSIVSESSSGC